MRGRSRIRAPPIFLFIHSQARSLRTYNRLMPRLRSVVFCTALFFCLLTLAILCRSYSSYDCITFNHLWGTDDNSHRLYMGAASERGELYLFIHTEHRTSEGFSLLTDPCAGPPGFTHHGALPSRPITPFASYEHTPSALNAHIILPHLLFVLSFAFPWVPGFFRYVRRHWRTRRQRCPQCSYDLRATPDHCPECGHIPAPTCATAKLTPLSSQPHLANNPMSSS